MIVPDIIAGVGGRGEVQLLPPFHVPILSTSSQTRYKPNPQQQKPCCSSADVSSLYRLFVSLLLAWSVSYSMRKGLYREKLGLGTSCCLRRRHVEFRRTSTVVAHQRDCIGRHHQQNVRSHQPPLSPCEIRFRPLSFQLLGPPPYIDRSFILLQVSQPWRNHGPNSAFASW